MTIDELDVIVKLGANPIVRVFRSEKVGISLLCHGVCTDITRTKTATPASLSLFSRAKTDDCSIFMVLNTSSSYRTLYDAREVIVDFLENDIVSITQHENFTIDIWTQH